MSTLTDIAVEGILKHLVGVERYELPEIYIGLFKTVPSVASNGVEVPTTSGGQSTNYARVAAPAGKWAVPDGRTIRNENTILFPTSENVNWGTIVALGVFDAATGGNLLWYAELGTPKTISVGQSVAIAPHRLTLTVVS